MRAVKQLLVIILANDRSDGTTVSTHLLSMTETNGEMLDVKPGHTTNLTKVSCDIQLHLVMDEKSYGLLCWLVDALEAASFGEVIRRALQAYEVFEPAEFAERAPLTNDELSALSSDDLRLVHARIHPRTKERLDRHKAETRATYADVVSQSLRVLAQLVRNREGSPRGKSDKLAHHGSDKGAKPLAAFRDISELHSQWMASV
jgi:hypothetical protein